MFADWIETIEISDAEEIEGFSELIDRENDLFLTFNYTSTLQVLYGARSVCHIHGKQGGKLLFGHGNETNYYEENLGKHTGAQDSLQKIQLMLRKNTEEAIRINHSFFNQISSAVKNIYSFGFSFSDVDLIYIRKICTLLPTESVIWYLNDFDTPKQREEFRTKIRGCGFMGMFEDYHIS